MKITINDFVLAEASGPVGVREFRINNRRSIEETGFLRAAAASFLDRKNQATVITFTVARLHATVRDAELFLLVHESEVPPVGVATFLARGDNGQEVARYLSDAVIEVTEASYIGVASRHLYTIKGGLLLQQAAGI